MRFKEDHYYLEQTRKGDLQGFGMLVQKHEKLVFTVCVRMLKNREEAEEACQDAFVKAFQSISGYSENSKFSTWVYKIAYNECLGRLRKKKIQFQLIEEITEDEVNLGSWANGLEQLLSEEREFIVRNAIEALSSNEALVITLFYLEELSIKEIAGITSMTESNIKVLLHRGRKNLAGSLQNSNDKSLIEIK